MVSATHDILIGLDAALSPIDQEPTVEPLDAPAISPSVSERNGKPAGAEPWFSDARLITRPRNCCCRC